ncbi:aliphatic sulfonate ABC transporter substrate-binding protein [Halalkalibacter sp. APA_J-10(15)]|uniref:aliphatic sulfonate ABC transporter substrate-binding protein n=1 Tax=Halalkalibacter sp. APA_J-10(15) TaxID=2933805 RepID=UPI001FF4D125|nr:aliphatic sulfonate ABC transporter substrate-binding protein [Halalkalibacter sp. APA_J-10(15)]MCK0471145.1 aliphatic sulfonate ABC transporter substrate-binding protein [Halalkalibacter sp. APA_J-10(15)]
MKKWILLITSATLLTFIAACGTANESTTGENSDEEAPGEDVRIGYFPNLDHAAAIIGKEKGYFDEELGNRGSEYTHFPNGNDFIDALSTGSLDIGYVGPGPAINYFLTGGDVVVLGAAANGATLIVSREDSGIESLDDFDGKSFCTPGNGCTHNVQLEIMLKELGLESNRVGGTVEHQSRIPPANMVAMFEQGQIDAAAAPEPWGTYLELELNANVVAEWDNVFIGETLPSVVIVTTNEFLEENPEAVEAVLRGHKQAVEYTQENTGDTLSAINDHLYELTQNRLPDAVLEKAWTRMVVTTETHPEALQDWADASYELKFMDAEPNLDGFVDTSKLDAILEAE